MAKVAPTTDQKIKFFEAVTGGNLEAVMKMIQSNEINPTIKDNEAIKIACTKGLLDIAIFLLNDPRVSPEFDDNMYCYKYLSNSLLHLASKNGHHQLVRALLSDDRYNVN
jgi:ankyrin repeat protein